MLKSFYLPKSYNISKGQGAINDLNNLLAEIGVSFKVKKDSKFKNDKIENGIKLFIHVDEQKLKEKTNLQVGRPIKYDFDVEQVKKMKAEGKTNKEIYESLGMSKSLFYLKMREYKNNIGL